MIVWTLNRKMLSISSQSQLLKIADNSRKETNTNSSTGLITGSISFGTLLQLALPVSEMTRIAKTAEALPKVITNSGLQVAGAGFLAGSLVLAAMLSMRSLTIALACLIWP